MTLTRKLLAALILVGAACAIVGAAFTQGTLHVARRTGPVFGEQIEITANDGPKLRASWVKPKRVGGCVLLLHGISDTRASYAGFAVMFAEQGYATLAPDSRAHGESGGEIVTYGLRETSDVLHWAQWLHEQGCDKIYGLGESLGASILIQAAAERPIFRAIIAESAYASLQDAAEVRMERMLPGPRTLVRPLAWLAVTNGKIYARIAYGLDFGLASPIDAMRKSSTPVLLIHGLDDELTPPEHARRLHAANLNISELWLVPGVSHESAYNADPREYLRRVMGWIRDH